MPNKILIIGGTFNKKGGIESLTESIFKCIDKSRSHVTLLGLYDGYYKSNSQVKIFNSLILFLLKNNIFPTRFKIFFIKTLGSYYIGKQKFDIIIFNHIHLWNLYNFKPKKKSIVWFHGREIWGMSKDEVIKKPNFEAVSVSHFTDKKIRSLFPNLQRHHIIHPPVDTNFFKPLNNPINNNGNILFVGRLNKDVEYKGLGILLEAISDIKNKGKNIGLTVVGDGDNSKYYKQLAIKLGIDKKVLFKKNLTKAELLEEYQNCLCFAMPSIGDGYNEGEGFGIVFIEAQSCGKIVITGTGGGSDDTIIKDITGYSVNNVDQLTKAIEIIHDLISCQKDTSRAIICREFVLDNFSIDQFKFELNNLIQCN